MIRAGVEPTDRVIVNGMLRVRPETQVDATEEVAPGAAGSSLAPPTAAVAEPKPAPAAPAAEASR